MGKGNRLYYYLRFFSIFLHIWVFLEPFRLKQNAVFFKMFYKHGVNGPKTSNLKKQNEKYEIKIFFVSKIWENVEKMIENEATDDNIYSLKEHFRYLIYLEIALSRKSNIEIYKDRSKITTK